MPGLHMHTQQFLLVHGSSYMSRTWWHPQEQALSILEGHSPTTPTTNKCFICLLRGNNSFQVPACYLTQTIIKYFYTHKKSQFCSFLCLRRKPISTWFPLCKHFCEGTRFLTASRQRRNHNADTIMSTFKADSVCLSDTISDAVFDIFL